MDSNVQSVSLELKRQICNVESVNISLKRQICNEQSVDLNLQRNIVQFIANFKIMFYGVTSHGNIELNQYIKPLIMILVKPINNGSITYEMVKDYVSGLAYHSTPIYPNRSNRG